MGRGQNGGVYERLSAPWSGFAEFIGERRQWAREPEEKSEHWWIAPFLVAGYRRRVEDIIGMAAWFAGDVDRDNLGINDLKAALGPWSQWLAYTSASSVPGASRWRVVVGLSRPHSVTEYTRLWRWFASRLPIDVHTKDASRLHFLPADWNGGDNQWHAQDGRPADVDSILSMVAADPVPPLPSPGDLRNAPDGTPIIPQSAIRQAMGRPDGGRLFSLMGQAAKRFRLNGWILSKGELAQAAMVASHQIAPGKARPGIEREAQRAIDWAARSFSIQTPLERMRERIRWEDRRRLSHFNPE